MAIKIIRGTIKVGEEYIGIGAVIVGMDAKDEQRLIGEQMAIYVPDSEAEEQCEGGFDLNNMTVAQLKAFAKENGIDIGKAKNKGPILDAIAAAAHSGDGDPDDDPEGHDNGGDPDA